jgi:hypothetical protein
MAALALWLPSTAPGEPGEVLFSEDFDGQPGSFATRLLAKKQVTLAKGQGPDRSNAIRVSYVGYPRGSERVVMGHPLKKAVRSATLSFDVMFDRDFQFVRGGKLHGLGPARPITGGKKRRPDGWSARVVFKDQGRGASYLYDQNPKLKWGLTETTSRSVFQKGRWHSVKLAVTVNDVGQSNGSAVITIDGKTVVRSTGIRFRDLDHPKTLISQFLFNTFHGGHSPPFAPVDQDGKFTTVHAYFDHFKVVEGIR